MIKLIPIVINYLTKTKTHYEQKGYRDEYLRKKSV
jgi:hypothetical protein